MSAPFADRIDQLEAEIKARPAGGDPGTARAELALLALLALIDPPLAATVDVVDQTRALSSSYDPWTVEIVDPHTGRSGCAGQRAFRRSRASIRVVVAGRQSGKTHAAAEEVVRVILERPGTDSCLLMPTYKSAKGAKKHVERALEPLGSLVRWKENDNCWVFPNGALLYVRTADDKTGVPTRGLTLDGVLWADEASFIPSTAWDAAIFALGAVPDPVAIVTTTARGRKGSWVFDLALEAEEDEGIEFFRFRTTDSPHHNPEFVARTRRLAGKAKADEELDAVFLGDSEAPFRPEDIETAFARPSIPLRGTQLTLGIDLAKKKDYTVLTLLNEFGEAHVLGRWRHVDWPDTERRIVEVAQAHGALCVVDEGHGGGYGGNMRDYLERALGKDRVFAVRTGNRGTKGQILELLSQEFEHGRIIVAGSIHATQLRHELTFFPAPERHNDGGVERLVYRGAISEDGEHDDCVLSLGLAKWGQVHGWEPVADPTAGDFSEFATDEMRGAAADAGGYGGFGA